MEADVAPACTNGGDNPEARVIPLSPLHTDVSSHERNASPDVGLVIPCRPDRL